MTLKSVEITAGKTDLSHIGKKSEKVDSLLLAQFPHQSLSDVLSAGSTVFIKNYGPGSIASTAFRGGSAEQTAVLWEGINLQNPMLGQADLSLLPSFLFENVTVEYGGSSALWGSGAVGGSILLGSGSRFNTGFSSALSLSGGSMGQENGWLSVSQSGKRFLSVSKMYRNSSTNVFPYVADHEGAGRRVRQQHARYDFRGLMQELRFLAGTRHMFSLGAWLSDNSRRVPGLPGQPDARRWQDDRAVRLTGSWRYAQGRYSMQNRAAWFRERLNYTDSLTPVFSENLANTVVAENENYFQWNRKHRSHLGVNLTRSGVISNNYSGERTLSRVSVLGGERLAFLDGKLLLHIGARLEYFSAGTLPLTGNVAADYRPAPGLKLSAGAARVYRQPTMNELYWQPGGNSDLRPEKGYAFDGSFEYVRRFGAFRAEVSGAAFSRNIGDWILWVPGSSGNPMPLNLQTVWSRGGETGWKLGFVKRKLSAAVSISTSYVLSTLVRSDLENNAGLHRQLINTPRYSGNGVASLVFHKSSLVFICQYTGYRFTSSDNLSWLEPFTMGILKASHVFTFRSMGLQIFAACNNLFNTHYRLMPGRPMPLRNFEAGLTVKFNPHKKQSP